MCENFLYFQLDEKAISFIQAEKMYYETVLIDDAELEKHLGRYCEKTLLYYPVTFFGCHLRVQIPISN